MHVACLHIQEKFLHTIVTAALKGYTVVLRRHCMKLHHVNFMEKELKHLQIVPKHVTGTHSSSTAPAHTIQKGGKAQRARFAPCSMKRFLQKEFKTVLYWHINFRT